MGNNTHLEKDTIAQVIALKEFGLKMKDIMAELGVGQHSVWYWFAEFYQRGSQDTATKERMPGPKKRQCISVET